MEEEGENMGLRKNMTFEVSLIKNHTLYGGQETKNVEAKLAETSKRKND